MIAKTSWKRVTALALAILIAHAPSAFAGRLLDSALQAAADVTAARPAPPERVAVVPGSSARLVAETRAEAMQASSGGGDGQPQPLARPPSDRRRGPGHARRAGGGRASRRSDALAPRAVGRQLRVGERPARAGRSGRLAVGAHRDRPLAGWECGVVAGAADRPVADPGAGHRRPGGRRATMITGWRVCVAAGPLFAALLAASACGGVTPGGSGTAGRNDGTPVEAPLEAVALPDLSQVSDSVREQIAARWRPVDGLQAGATAPGATAAETCGALGGSFSGRFSPKP